MRLFRRITKRIDARGKKLHLQTTFVNGSGTIRLARKQIATAGFRFKHAFVRNGFKLEDISNWRVVEEGYRGEATIFENMQNRRFVVKPCITSSPKTVFMNCVDILAAKVPFEVPLAVLVAEGRKSFLVTRAMGEETLSNMLFHPFKRNPKKMINYSEQAGRALARLHNANFLHGHPHWLNFVVTKTGIVRLIDATKIKRRGRLQTWRSWQTELTSERNTAVIDLIQTIRGRKEIAKGYNQLEGEEMAIVRAFADSYNAERIKKLKVSPNTFVSETELGIIRQ